MKSPEKEQFHGIERALQAGLTAILAWLAIYLSIATNLFMANPDFAYMAKIAPERVWAVLFLLAANIGGFGLISRTFAIKLTSVLLIATAHGVFALSLIMAAAGIWSGTFVVIAVLGYYLSYRLARAAPTRDAVDARPRG